VNVVLVTSMIELTCIYRRS